MKKIKAILLICLSITMICACGKSQEVPEKDYVEKTAEPDEVKKESGWDSSKEEKDFVRDDEKDEVESWREEYDAYLEKEEQVYAAVYPTYEAAYLAYLDFLLGDDGANGFTFSFIYVDDDDIPELVIDSGYEAGGCKVLTFHDGVMDGWQSGRLYFTYIERGNLICNSEGNMGHYYDWVYTIQDGKWCYVDGGVYGDPPDADRPQFDENGELICVYRWGEEEEVVSEEEYETHLNEVYPLEQQKKVEKYYVLREIRSVLETGGVTSANHRYELVVEDLTWSEAESLCREKGGYLATITSWDEMERIQEQIVLEDKTNVTFFIGAHNESESIIHHYYWHEPENGEAYEMIPIYDILWDFWLKGEPSESGLTEDGVEVDEDCVVIFYRKADERCYLNDVPDDILSAAPSYAGKVGYVCEYDR